MPHRPDFGCFGNSQGSGRRDASVFDRFTINVECIQSQPLPLSFVVNLSAGGSGGYATRRMVGGSSQLQYNLFSDAARAQVWGDGTGASANVTRSFNGQRFVDESINVYGRVFGGQTVNSGAYVDTIVVTVIY